MSDVKALVVAAEANEARVIERRKVIEAAITDAGGSVVDSAEANTVIWLRSAEPKALQQLLQDNAGVRWAQLPSAGIESFVTPELLAGEVTFTCAKGAYAEEVAEHALMLTMGVLRDVGRQVRAAEWLEVEPSTLHRKRVTVLGGGGITTEYLRLIEPFACVTRVLRKSQEPVLGASQTLHTSQLPDVLPETDVLVLALALTPESRGIIGSKELALLPEHAVVVNVARGAHIDSEALVDALQSSSIAGAGLDVTDPEPLPTGHPLWEMPNVLVTSHCADSYVGCTEALAKRVGDNVALRLQDEQLIGIVDPASSY